MSTYYKDDFNLSNIYESMLYGNVLSEEAPTRPLSDLEKFAIQEVNKAVEAVQNSDVFFSKIIAGMKRIMSYNGDTMSTDGKNLLYNPNFVKELVDYGGNHSVQGIIVHEILHIAFSHHYAFAKELDQAIKTGNEQLKWLVNVACDLAINSFLIGRPGFPQENIFIPSVSPNREPFISFPKDKDARWYYNQLVEYYKNKSRPKSGPTTRPR